MASYNTVGILPLVTLLYAVTVSADELCYSGGSIIEICSDGYHCCNNNQVCCKDGLSIGEIIGLVIGLLAFVCCIAALVFLCMKKKKTTGAIVGPTNHHNVTAISTVHAVPHYGQQHYGPNMGYRGYGQQPPPPPQYPYGQGGPMNGNPAYPPSPFVPQPPAYANPAKGMDPAYPPTS